MPHKDQLSETFSKSTEGAKHETMKKFNMAAEAWVLEGSNWGEHVGAQRMEMEH